MRKTIITVIAVLALGGVATACDTGASSDHPFTGKAQHSKGETKGETKAEDLTTAQEQAIGSAQNYLQLSGFSRAGLIGQLSSKAGDGFKLADATFAVDHIKVDWNKQAVRSAKQYLDMTNFSRSGLIGQLSSKAGDEYTVAQATYAANHVGL
jgi:hypothetical protein